MKVNPNICWENSLTLVRENVSSQQFATWFQPIIFESFNEETKMLVIKVPSSFFAEYLEEHYIHLLTKIFLRTFGEKIRLTYRVIVDNEHKKTQDFEAEPIDANLAPKARTNANQPPSLLDAALPQDLNPQLNPHQTFDNYIEGLSNKLPRAVGLSIAEHPNNNQFNPMFIYGPSGCGKTHLINAIGVHVKQLYPRKRVLYISARLFQQQFSESVLKNVTNDFISFYQTIDVLIVDDIQEWMTAVKTQDTFFHIFRNLQAITAYLAVQDVYAKLNIRLFQFGNKSA